MHPIKILIIEDNKQEAEVLSRSLAQLGYEVTAVVADLQAALGSFYSLTPDIVIADIMLQGKNEGITFAASIHEKPELARPVIFLTGMMDKDTFLAAKMTRPVSYLLKPFHILELEFAIELAIESWAGCTGAFATDKAIGLFMAEHFFIKKRDNLVKVALSSIHYLEVSGKYCHIASEEGKFLVQKSLKEMLQLLAGQRFQRTHRNYIVHLDRIKALNLQDNHVELVSGTCVPLSREYKKQLTDTLNILL